MMRTAAGVIRATTWLLAALVLLAARGSDAHAQSLQGRVVDEDTGAPVAGARIVVRTSVDLHSGESDQDGRFLVQLRRAGEHRVQVAHPDYADVRVMFVDIVDGRSAQVLIRLSRDVVRGDTLVVVATARDRFHEASFEGAMARREQLPDYGFRRVVTHDDVELANAFRVRDGLNWFPPARCTAIYYDGRFVRSSQWQRDWLDASASMVEAVEFYRQSYQAPRAYRNEPLLADCAVLALWSRREPTNTRRPLLKLAGTVAASVLMVLLVR